LRIQKVMYVSTTAARRYVAVSKIVWPRDPSYWRMVR
jgi:hypothetical protein